MNKIEIKPSNYVSESQHWYSTDGMPMYTIIGKNGKERNTTLRDARKFNLVPSVTMIVKESAKPGLDNWKQDQVLMAALTLPIIEGESESDYITRIKEDSKQQAVKAAERGKDIHTWIQQGFGGMPIKDEAEIYYHIAREEIERHCGVISWLSEIPFATGKYGGKVDIHNSQFILDIKTKDTSLENIRTWDEHDMQIAAYRNGLNIHHAKGGILFVSTKELEAKLIWIEEEKLQRGIKMFNALLGYWYAKTGLGEVK